ncbi:phospho-sugar mutase [Trueperella bialowiezensis]|uniref:Probable phosphomannomutase n=1 Tax=Trueperella bialowiezensis TaxID=312285 RepID=A0A3S4WHA5_9ACTO|nr:phospho-sugar mutase [Trueperella bialowiezensis]VEI13935.1 Probable phosphomannomutase [Trueperella bialowiezensis]
MTDMSALAEYVRSWINADPSPSDREELENLLERATSDDAARTELADRFAGTLQFGTAGLRGQMAAGPNRMNTAVVRRAAAGLTAWLVDTVAADPLVVIGFDARYNSQQFAEDTAAIVTAAGGRALLMPSPLPTPLLAYAVRKLGADAGVMVTASHNPPQDNGYKVYLGGRAAGKDGQGVQIIPPVDGQIAEKIAAAPPANKVPMASGWQVLDNSIVTDYISDTLAAFAPNAPDSATAQNLKIVYTPMHGVGNALVGPLLEQAGFTDVVPVDSQINPDPDFPTVAFPNPEEAGALDEAIATATRVGADIIIASDPDADRCSVAIPADAGWRQLSGDEIGSILGEHVAASGAAGTLASSIVSSQLLEQIARHHGMNYEATLTGFKWIARAAEIAFGYEEAIGFCVLPELVKDKDGVSAALALATIAAKAKAAGGSLQDVLDQLAIRHGVYHTAPVTVRVADLAVIPATMAKIRTAPPTELIGSPVASVEDLANGSGDLPPTDAIRIRTQAGDRVIIRPSGTEPKVKCYLEVIEPVAGPDALADARSAAAERMERFKADVAKLLEL